VASVIIPLHDRIPVVRPLHGAEFSGRLSEVAQTLDPISLDSVLRRWQGEWRAPAFWHGVNQEPRRNVKGAVGYVRAARVSDLSYSGSSDSVHGDNSFATTAAGGWDPEIRLTKHSS
jgi:hypothetical protein